MRSNLLYSMLFLVGLVVGVKLLVQQLGLTITLTLLTFVAIVLALGWLVSSGHPFAVKLAANWFTRPLVKLVCLLGKMPMPTPPITAAPKVGGPTPRTPADFELLQHQWKSVVFGQDTAIDAISETLRQAITLRIRQGETPTPRRPLAVLLLVGGEGLGKRTLLETVGRSIYPDGQLTTLTLSPNDDAAARLAEAVQSQECHTVILERLEMASSQSLEVLRRAVETGDLLNPTTGSAVAIGTVIIGLTTTDAKLPERLGPSYLRVVGRAILFPQPEPLVLAQIVVALLDAECRAHKLKLDYVDEAIVARLVGEFDPRHGFRVLAARVAELLTPEIYKAIEHQHDCLALVEDPA